MGVHTTVLQTSKYNFALMAGGAVVVMLFVSANSSTKEAWALPEAAPMQVVDPCDAEITALKTKMASVVVPFTSSTPPRCSRIAVSVQTPKGIVPIVAEATVEKTEGSVGRILVNPDRIPLLEYARSRGAQLSYVTLPQGSPSPYQGATISDISTLTAYFPVEIMGDPFPWLKEGCTGYSRSGDKEYCIQNGKVHFYDSAADKWLELKHHGDSGRSPDGAERHSGGEDPDKR